MLPGTKRIHYNTYGKIKLNTHKPFRRTCPRCGSHDIIINAQDDITAVLLQIGCLALYHGRCRNNPYSEIQLGEGWMFQQLHDKGLNLVIVELPGKRLQYRDKTCVYMYIDVKNHLSTSKKRILPSKKQISTSPNTPPALAVSKAPKTSCGLLSLPSHA